jgi:sugar-specific transcriptional regulator TrmB
MTSFNQELLEHIGLTKDETKMYATLLASEALSVQQLSDATGIKRGNAYNVAESLERKGAAEKVLVRSVTHFRATEPTQLLALAEQAEEQARHHREALELAVPGMMSSFLITHHQPVIRTFEGLKGLQKIYDDILRTKEDILLIRSVYDDDSYHLVQMVDKQIRAQVRAGIGVRLIAPYTQEGIERMRTVDTKNHVERRMIPAERLTLPAQVIVYGNKVAITDLKNADTMISTLIENVSIAESFRTLFEYMWEQATPEHYALMKQLIGLGGQEE